MIDSLISSPTTTMLEQAVSFTEQRHAVILQNIANVSVPGYVQQDVSVAGFQQAMRDAVDRQRASYNDDFEPQSNDNVAFSSAGSRVAVIPHAATDAQPFHDRGVRSVESLMGDLADNAMAHNMATQLLKSRYDWITKAINLKP
jgi:flagellar basal-body rod protein FlgB